MTQAINLIDGLDGLAAGIVAIASGAFFIYSQHLGDLELLAEPNIGPLIAIITVGVCVGFLPFNFNPASIFMGRWRCVPARISARGQHERRRWAGRSGNAALQRTDVLLSRTTLHSVDHSGSADLRRDIRSLCGESDAEEVLQLPTRGICTTDSSTWDMARDVP